MYGFFFAFVVGVTLVLSIMLLLVVRSLARIRDDVARLVWHERSKAIHARTLWLTAAGASAEDAAAVVAREFPERA